MAQQAGPKAHDTEVIFYCWWTGLGWAGIDDLLVINITFRHTNTCECTKNNAYKFYFQCPIQLSTHSLCYQSDLDLPNDNI